MFQPIVALLRNAYLVQYVTMDKNKLTTFATTNLSVFQDAVLIMSVLILRNACKSVMLTQTVELSVALLITALLLLFALEGSKMEIIVTPLLNALHRHVSIQSVFPNNNTLITTQSLESLLSSSLFFVLSCHFA